MEAVGTKPNQTIMPRNVVMRTNLANQNELTKRSL